MSDQTPILDDVRDLYAYASGQGLVPAQEAFDRMIDAVLAEARAAAEKRMRALRETVPPDTQWERGHRSGVREAITAMNEVDEK